MGNPQERGKSMRGWKRSGMLAKCLMIGQAYPSHLKRTPWPFQEGPESNPGWILYECFHFRQTRSRAGMYEGKGRGKEKTQKGCC